MTADPRFKVRGPYFRPGMSILVEPWAAVATTNIGDWVVLHGCHSDRALGMVTTWRLHAEAGRPIDPLLGIYAVSAAVVNPRGEVTASWQCGDATPPRPGGEPRWTPLLRVATPVICLGCAAERWPGCWMRRDQRGCSQCMPELEAADPRVWPLEPPAPGAPVAARVKTPKVRKPPQRVQVVSPDGDRLL